MQLQAWVSSGSCGVEHLAGAVVQLVRAEVSSTRSNTTHSASSSPCRDANWTPASGEPSGTVCSSSQPARCWVNRRCSARRIAARSTSACQPRRAAGRQPRPEQLPNPSVACSAASCGGSTMQSSSADRTGRGPDHGQDLQVAGQPAATDVQGVPQPARVVPPATKAPVDGLLPRCPRPRLPGRSRPGAPAGRWRGCRPAAPVDGGGRDVSGRVSQRRRGAGRGQHLRFRPRASRPRAAPGPRPAAQYRVQAGGPGLHRRRLVPLSQQDRSLRGHPRPGQLPADTDGSSALGSVPHRPGLPHPHRGRRPAARRAAPAAP